MATIGFVRQREMKLKDGSTAKWLEMSARYPGGSFTATITKIKEKSQDNSPDYDIWFSPNRRGEHYDRQKCGALWMKTSEKGNPYLSGYVESPSFSSGKIYLSIVKYTHREGMPKQDILYNVLWSPPEERRSGGYGDDYGYSPASLQTRTESPSTSTPAPVEIEIVEESIPF